jgi:hypothetical protein
MYVQNIILLKRIISSAFLKSCTLWKGGHQETAEQRFSVRKEDHHQAAYGMLSPIQVRTKSF